MEICDTCPGGSFIIGVDVVPAVGRRIVHDTTASINALRGEVRTVSADFLIIVKGRIAAISPYVGISNYCRPIVWDKSQQRNHLLKQYMCPEYRVYKKMIILDKYVLC